MLVPSIDLMDGHAVQLIGGEEKALDAGDPAPVAARFGRVGEVAVIDLDAALGRGSNAGVIKALLPGIRARVGGGIRSYEAALDWLDAGAWRIILGTAAKPELLSRLPRERVIAALDARDGEVVVEGWRKRTGEDLLGRIAALRDHVGGFLVTFVEREGRLGGTDLALAKAVVEAAGTAHVTIAGGVTTAEEIRALDAIGADAQVGMALYTDRLPLAEAFAAPLRTDRADGLYATVVADERGQALGLAWSSRESLARAIETGKGVYRSRSRSSIWVKGESSGATQELLRVELDCDRDAIRFTVRQKGAGFCHLDTPTCWGDERGLAALVRTLEARRADAPKGSYTARLFADRTLLDGKLLEEAKELTEAQARGNVVHEAADVLFFTLARLAAEGIPLAEVEAELDRRALKVTRRD
ncbi:phosphoribosyl-ATP diphosphatase [Marinivivus vitaminiproducens]|uniref:phosphoribosyl-ATP diphosphatase n=1 Tax=Marinivivus vitaminiproducens TaxID=3035935 RepID=UPI0027A04ACB|nr:phosphoribosyl-ATP diphosphatase [Geminicoccaceae bacterium SCSIO 64248]